MERVMLGSDQAMADLPSVLVVTPIHPTLAQCPAGIPPFVKGDLVCVFGCGGDRDGNPQMAAVVAELADRGGHLG